MAFTPGTLVQQSLPPSPPQYGLPQIWGYYTASDNQATVSAADYFNLNPGLIIGRNSTFFIGDVINCVCTDGNIQLQITALTPNILTAVPNADIAAGSITTAMLGANIVTAAKIANGAITTTQINASAGIVGTQLAANTLSDTQIAVGGVSSASLNPNTIQYAKVPMTLANFTGMYAAPFQLVAAPAAGQMIVLQTMLLDWVYGSAALTAGGAITAQLGNTVHAGGVIVSGSIAAADLTGLSASSGEIANGLLAITANTSLTAVGLYLSNATAAFATGTGGSANVHVWYRIITL